jgi:hypothetical protein
VSGDLESFYFSSELGQVVCERAPQDGILISIPDGQGVRLMVNGTELTLTGSASLTAVRNGLMNVSLYSGAARVAAAGADQYFGAGQKVDVQLGGPDGRLAVSAPSTPAPLARDELDTSCALTGEYCAPEEIVPVSADQARAAVEAAAAPAAPEAFSPPADGTPDSAATPSETPAPLAAPFPSDTPARGPAAPGSMAATAAAKNEAKQEAKQEEKEDRQEEKDEKKEEKQK